MSNFTAEVHAIVKKIPAGQTMTYKQVATLAGKPKGARAVGMIMSKNFNPQIPCHRVIRSDGGLGGYNRGGVTIKQQILNHEASTRN